MNATYQLFANLNPAIEAALRASIDRFGVLVPVAKDQHGNILDGHQRARIAESFGLKYPVNIIEVADDDEAFEIARTLNEDRRAMPKEERLPVVQSLREEGHSLRAIAGAVGVSKSQVVEDLSGVQDCTPDRTTGKDGKSYPARREPKLPPAEVLRAARDIKRERREERDRERIEQRAQILEESHPLRGEKWRVFEWDVFNGAPSIPAPQIIVTDPPYPEEYLPTFGALDLLAADLLPEGGSLLAMSGQSHLPRVFEQIQRMRYQWTLGYFTPGESTQQFGRRVKSNWKPVLWYVKGVYEGEHIEDTIRSGENDKRFHEWGQSVSGMAALIERFTVPGDVVYDPFCGGGATGVAALLTGRLFIGSDIDPACVSQTAARLAEVR